MRSPSPQWIPFLVCAAAIAGGRTLLAAEPREASDAAEAAEATAVAAETLLTPPAAAEAAAPDRITALNQYLASIEDRRWADALAPAQRLLELARAGNPGSIALAEALTRLGGVQFALSDYPQAEANFVEAILLVEAQEGPLSRSLEEPLRGLGYTLNAMERHAEAVSILDRALLVSQRHNGLFDLSQRGLRQQLGMAHSELGNFLAAQQQYGYILETAERAYGLEDVRLAETLDFVADWYARWGHFGPSRELYRRAIGLVEKGASPTDTRLVNPLRSLGRSYTRELLFANAGQVLPAADGSLPRPLRRQRLPEEGEQALLRALDIMERAEQRNPAAWRAALIDAGDWFWLKEDSGQALNFYRRALAQPAPVTAAAAGDPLSYPSQLDYQLPPVARRFLDRPADRVVERALVAEFTVNRNGAVADVRVIEGDATERMQRETLAALRNALYRPRFENGEPVDTANVRFRQTFRELKN